MSNLTQRLLMSTALPMKDENGVYYTPRQQGAGLVNVDGAVHTPRLHHRPGPERWQAGAEG